ncbi:MAG TPA: FmdB family zinc ribbon protein [Candidatus Binatia bacterium]|jgi:putative FmdB family regulatory protein
MPIFEYSCQNCENHFEELVLNSTETVSCPKCSSKSVYKQLSVFSSPGPEPQAASGGGCGCTPQTCGCH